MSASCRKACQRGEMARMGLAERMPWIADTVIGRCVLGNRCGLSGSSVELEVADAAPTDCPVRVASTKASGNSWSAEDLASLQRFERPRAREGEQQLRLRARRADALHAQIEGPRSPAGLSSGEKSCTWPSSDTSRSCTFSLPAPSMLPVRAWPLFRLRFADLHARPVATLAAQARQKSESGALLRCHLPHLDVGFESVRLLERIVENLECGLVSAVAVDARGVCPDAVRRDEEAVAALVLGDIALDLCGAAGRRRQGGGIDPPGCW